MFDGYVFVDQLPNNDSNEPAVHIYTRPFDLSKVKPRDSLNIYTTAVLKSVMIYDTNLGVRNSIKILNEGDVPYCIELPNCETIFIKVFSCNSTTLNVLVLFEYCDRFTLYAGRFIAESSILFKDHKTNKDLREKMLAKKIDDLYIDVTTANICEFNLQRKACEEIESLVKSNECYQFHMLVIEFGYEELIYRLAKKGIRIFLDHKRVEIFKRLHCMHIFPTDAKTADIVLVNQLSNDTPSEYKHKKIISIKLMAEPKEKSSDSLRIIQFSIHPTISDIEFIANLTAPLHIFPVGELPELPFDLNYFCRYDDNYNKENQYVGNR